MGMDIDNLDVLMLQLPTWQNLSGATCVDENDDANLTRMEEKSKMVNIMQFLWRYPYRCPICFCRLFEPLSLFIIHHLSSLLLSGNERVEIQ